MKHFYLKKITPYTDLEFGDIVFDHNLEIYDSLGRIMPGIDLTKEDIQELKELLQGE